MGEVEKRARAAADESVQEVSVAKKLLVFALLSAVFIGIGAYPPLRERLRPHELNLLVESLGWKGPLLLALAGTLTPLLLLPRWPLAVVSGLVYGVFWGSLLANSASLAGAWLQYRLARSTLAPIAGRLLARNRWRRLFEGRGNSFVCLFLVRAFPLSSFVATNLACGALRLPGRIYLAASALGMLPSTVLYAAWGKVTVKPSGGFVLLAFVTLAFIVAGTLYARRFLTAADDARRDAEA